MQSLKKRRHCSKGGGEEMFSIRTAGLEDPIRTIRSNGYCPLHLNDYSFMQ